MQKNSSNLKAVLVTTCAAAAGLMLLMLWIAVSYRPGSGANAH